VSRWRSHRFRRSPWDAPEGRARTFKVGAATVLDALLAYNKDNWRLSLNVTNLADTRYVAACYSLSGCFYAEGRKAIARVAYRW
jgi:iron complex outermembrane recepter protein